MIEVKNLCKSFSDHQVLTDFSLQIPDGSVCGIVGPNGAGKTTTFRIIAGLLKADSGEVLVDDTDIRFGSKDLIGYMPDFFGVYDKLRVAEYMEFFASIYNIDAARTAEKTESLLDLVGLSGLENTYVDSLSRGMKQKLCLARCLIHDPRLLILDEPASGLDPRARIEFRDLIRKLHERGTTILISSHILSELAQMCTDICIINNGKNVISGTVSDIEYRMTSSVKLVIKVTNGIQKAISVLNSDPLADKLSYSGNEIYVTYSGSHEEEAELLSRLTEEGAGVYSFGNDRGGLEDLFLEITDSKNNTGSDSYDF